MTFHGTLTIPLKYTTPIWANLAFQIQPEKYVKMFSETASARLHLWLWLHYRVQHSGHLRTISSGHQGQYNLCSNAVQVNLELIKLFWVQTSNELKV